MTIHRTDELPLMDEYGYNVKSATHTSLAIREETIKRLKSPYSSHCVDEWEETNYTQIVPKTTDGSGEAHINSELLLREKSYIFFILWNSGHFMDGWEYSVTVSKTHFFFASRGTLRNHSPSAPTLPSSGKPLPFFDFRRGMGMD